jgi:hypothetical protein
MKLNKIDLEQKHHLKQSLNYETMGTNTFDSKLRDYSYMGITLMVLYCAMFWALVMGIYQIIFKPCKYESTNRMR